MTFMCFNTDGHWGEMFYKIKSLKIVNNQLLFHYLRCYMRCVCYVLQIKIRDTYR